MLRILSLPSNIVIQELSWVFDDFGLMTGDALCLVKYLLSKFIRPA